MGGSVFSMNKSEVLGEGSNGTVYKARRDADKFPCAAKVLRKALVDSSNPERTETIQKIKSECLSLEGLKHTNIVQYLGVTGDLELRAPALLMELLPDAESLTKMLAENKNEPLPYFTEVNICCDIASAVEYLHSKKVIIRNLSSNNVLVIAKMRAKVADFGMCKLNDVMNTTCSGTTVYMPPEAFVPEPVYTEKLDCFCQGVIMIQVCTRKNPDPRNMKEIVEASTGQASVKDGNETGMKILSIAKDCLQDKADDRPTGAEIRERLATLKTQKEYQNSLESNYKKLWEDIKGQARLIMNSKKKYTGKVKSEENTGEEATVSDIEQFEQLLKNANKICILVVGTSGDGVSTLLNGLFGEEKCQPHKIEKKLKFEVPVDTFKIRGIVEVTVINCRNLHADIGNIDDNVSEVIEKVRPHGSPDLIIYSQKMGENIDFVSEVKHKSVITRLAARFANLDGSRAHKDIWKRCIFVLTFANEYEASLSGEQQDKEKRFSSRQNEWWKLFKQALNDSKIHIPLKVCIAGFRESKLHKSDHWLSDIWLAAFLTLTKSGALALLQINAFRFIKAALVSEDLHPAEQFIIIDPSLAIINSAGAALGSGIISFRVAAGSGLALGIVLGSAVGLGVSGGIAAALKPYREDKKFSKLPPLS